MAKKLYCLFVRPLIINNKNKKCSLGAAYIVEQYTRLKFCAHNIGNFYNV